MKQRNKPSKQIATNPTSYAKKPDIKLSEDEFDFMLRMGMVYDTNIRDKNKEKRKKNA